MTIITEIDLKFKSGNDVQVQDVRLTRDEWAQVKAYMEGVRTGRGCCTECRKPIVKADRLHLGDGSYIGYEDNGTCPRCQLIAYCKATGHSTEDIAWSRVVPKCC